MKRRPGRVGGGVAMCRWRVGMIDLQTNNPQRSAANYQKQGLDKGGISLQDSEGAGSCNTTISDFLASGTVKHFCCKQSNWWYFVTTAQGSNTPSLLKISPPWAFR